MITRSRTLEILAAVVGVAIVVFLYADRSWWGDSEPSSARPPPVVETPVASTPGESVRPTPAPAQATLREAAPADSELVTDDPDVAVAMAAWEAARTELESVTAELEQLDAVFDAKEAEFAELEAEGMDSDALEEEMLMFLAGMVDQYDELETLLTEAETLESAAAERLAALRGE